MNKELIKFEVKKEKGFRGNKYIATAYVDENGIQIEEEPQEGTDVIEIKTEIRSTSDILTNEIVNELVEAIEVEANKIKPLYIL